VSEEKQSWKHLPALDGVRGFAALIVVICHFYCALPIPATRISKALYNITDWGVTGVDLFFVLSGFLITGILLTMKGSPRAWVNFYMRRILRIFPLYYGVLIFLTVLSLIITKNLPGLTNNWWFWVYGQNIPPTFFSNQAAQDAQFPLPAGHLWSLAVEEHFYLIWPVIVLTLDRKNLSRILLAIIGSAIVCRMLMWQRFGFGIYYFTLCRMDSLAIGSIIAVYWQDPASVKKMVSLSKLFFLVTLVFLLPMRIFLTGTNMAVIQYVKYSLIATAYGAGLILILTNNVPFMAGKFFNAGWLRNFGKYSYAIYIFHPFCIKAFSNMIGGLQSVKSFLFAQFLMVIAILFIYGLSWCSWHFYERHFLSLKKYFTYQS